MTDIQTKRKNRIGLAEILETAGLSILFLIILGLFMDFYYELNDDVLIKDIISGAYTGIADAHNNQMMYPFSLILATLYRIIPKVQWFAIAELLSVAFSMTVIMLSAYKWINGKIQRLIADIVILIVFAGGFLWELTMVQYSVVSGLLIAAAAAWFFSNSDSEDIGDFISQNTITFVLIGLAFNYRSEMFLLFTPLLAGVGLYRWSYEKKPFSSDNFKKYGAFVGIVAVILGITFIWDALAYASPEWKEFRDFFDARTNVYDFTGIPAYDDNKEFYSSIGLNEEDYESLVTYNYDLNPNITTESLNAIADYVNSGNAVSNRNPVGVVGATKEYIKGAISLNKIKETDEIHSVYVHQHAPLEKIALFLYVVLFVLLIAVKEYRKLILVMAMVVFRSIAWIFLYMKQRVVCRIADPLCMFEIIIILLFLLALMHGKNKQILVAGIILSIGLGAFIPAGVKEITYKQANRAVVNEKLNEFNQYAMDNSASYYYLDVYSTVAFTEKMFPEKGYDKCNQQLMGGWISRSPLDEFKKSEYGLGDCYMATLDGNLWKYTLINGFGKVTEGFDPKIDEYVQASVETEVTETPVNINNFFSNLSVPTYTYKSGDDFFIVDCYNNQIIYSEDIEAPLGEWKIMTSEITRAHSIASDGQVYLVDDTENNRVLIYEKFDTEDGLAFARTQAFNEIGKRPHYTVYDKSTDTFYVWSSESGEMYLFRRDAGSRRVYLTDIKKIDCLSDIYVRSFTILGDEIYLGAGIGRPYITVVDKYSFQVKKEIEVPFELQGMVQIEKIGRFFYITASTDGAGNQEAANLIRVRNLDNLIRGEYEKIYDNFIGGGTPYHITEIEGKCYLTEHRLPEHGLWSFRLNGDEITEVKTVQK